ncbi:MAG: aspartate aminotransferase family protein [Actinobacteria bacterium]|nr:MAG: aspartate aminotransferase family protein [Actinomycetota bacterium]
MTGRDYHADADRFVLHSLRRDRQLVFERGEGARLWDVDGKMYLDAISGTNGPAMIGHSHPKVAEAVGRQLTQLPSTFLAHDSIPVVDFCRKIAEIAPPGLSKTFLCPGGGEAVEAALKLAIRVSGRPEVISLHGAYHGMSLATMGLSGIPSLREWFPGGVRWPTFHQVPSGDSYRPQVADREDENESSAARALEATLDGGTYGHVGALIIELVQGPGGHVVYGRNYYREVQRICRERDILLIVDEVQTGLARCGEMWACDVFDVQPDILVVGKAFGGGFPFGAAIVRADLVDDQLEREPWHILTFQNQPLQAAAGLAVIGVVEEEELVERARVLGERACSRLQQLAASYEVVGDIRGPGLFIGIDLVEDRDTKKPATAACRAAWAWALDHGLITWFGGAGNVLKFKPPLNTPETDFDEMLDLVEQTVAFVEDQVVSSRGVAA